jgi:hypothetical protein
MVSQINTRQLSLILVTGLGILFALFAGNYVADEDYTPIAVVLGFLVVVTMIFGVGQSIYALIPICWGLTGKISVLPLPFDVRQLVIMLACGLFIPAIIFKSKMRKTSFERIDLWVWINLIYIATTFFRNPVGVAAIGGSARVGGKPYVDVILGLMAYLMLSRFRISPKFASALPLYIVLVSAFTAFAGGVAMLVPSVGSVLGKFYSAFLDTSYYAGGDAVQAVVGETRLGFLTGLGSSLILFCISSVNPIQLIRIYNLKLLIFYCSGYILILLGGFRNGIIAAVLQTAVAIFIRDRFVGIVKFLFLTFIIAVGGILLSYSPVNIPFTFQRALCFLPGNWDETAKSDAQGSSEWRFEMWKMALTSDKYIKSKFLGDGFGFLREDFERGVDMMYGRARLAVGEVEQEQFMLGGDFHSGPVSSIRFVGYVGLALFLVLLMQSVSCGTNLIRKAIGSPFEKISLFIVVPLIVYPLFFVFVFGDYRTAIVDVLYFVGMMKLLTFSLQDYQAGRGRGNALHPALSPSL